MYKLSLLEILDISRNKVRTVSHEVKNLTSLRVFSLMHNRIDDLPPELAEMTKLQILKITENPLRPRLRRVVEMKEAELACLEMTDTERETAITAEIKRHLRESKPVFLPIDPESGAETSEGFLETPRPLKKVLSSRFPVIPSTSSSDSAGDLTTKSPSQARPPPIPTRSHHRILSGQNASLLRRPGIAPLINGSERNRSNSESVLQASAAARSKRMGMMRKEKTDLSTVEEGKTNRHSHLRGFSHGSALRSRSGNISSSASGSASSPSSPNDGRRQRLAYVRRLSSLPEHKQENDWRSPIIEGAKGILYALYQVYPQISGLINVIKGKDSRRTSLELTFYNASSHVDRLNEALDHADSVDEEDEDALERAEDNVQRDCAACIMAHTHVTSQLQDHVRRIVAGADARYVRTLMLLLYGSMVEMKNAVICFGLDVQTSTAPPTVTDNDGYPSVKEDLTPPQLAMQSSTPIRDRPLGSSRPGSRFRSDTTIQHSTLETIPDQPPDQSFAQQSSGQYSTPIHLTGSTLNGYSYNGSISSSAYSITFGSSAGARSRSNSRNTTYQSLANSSASSAASTPRSGESFPLPPPNTISHRLNPTTGLTDSQEEALFEGIFLALTKAYDSALQAVPIARRQFVRCLEAAEEARHPKEMRNLWSNLIWRCKTCLEVSEALHVRVVKMKLKDPNSSMNGVVEGRNDRSFWQLCKTFMQSFVDLVTEMREAKSLRLIAQDVVVVLRPVQKASREAGRLIEASPWGFMTDASAMYPTFPNMYAHGNGIYTNGINSVNGLHPIATSLPANQATMSSVTIPTTLSQSNLIGTSSATVPFPATPLAAALGPAAQATVPSTPATSTPASAYGDQFFAGNVFQRADSLLNMPQTSGINFGTRR